MARKEYEKTIKRYSQVYDQYDPKKTFEAVKKEAARMVGDLDRWMTDQKTNGWEDETEIFEETTFPRIKEAKQLRYRIYYQNPILNDAYVKLAVAQQTNDEKAFKEAEEEITEIECVVQGLAWRIYKIYSKLKTEIVIVPKQSKKEKEAELKAEYNETGYKYDEDLERFGGV